jgi:hypothetical protein
VQRLRRPSNATALAAVATAIALASAWHTGDRMWRHLGEQGRVYGNYTDEQRRHAAIDSMGMPSDIFDWYRQFVVRGDRIYYQVRASGYSSFFDLPTAIRYVGAYYLLPALPAKDLADATVVITFFDDPKALGVSYVTQQQAGIQPIFVSRIKAP